MLFLMPGFVISRVALVLSGFQSWSAVFLDLGSALILFGFLASDSKSVKHLNLIDKDAFFSKLTQNFESTKHANKLLRFVFL